MKNILFLLGGGALVYWYMCNSKKHNCNCKGDLDKVKTIGEETAQYLNEAILEKDGSYNNRPAIQSSGENEIRVEETNDNELVPVYDRGSFLTAFNMNSRPVRKSISSLYKRYNTSKQAITSPSRVRVIVID